jgi:hypothetical protein
MKKSLSLISLICLTCFSSCDIYEQDEFPSEVLVEAYLFALEPLPTIRLSRTVSFGRAYDFERQAVSNANVSILLLDKNGLIEKEYVHRESERGVYYPDQKEELVLPRRTYELVVTLPNSDLILRSTTVVPDTFSIVNISADTIVYQSDEQLEVTVTRSYYPGRQNIFIFSTESMDPRPEQLTPFVNDFLIDDEDDLEDFRVSESPLINEGNFDVNQDGTLTIKYPWIALIFFGPNRISVNAADDNIFDFVRSRDIQTRGSTLSPGEILAIVDHVEGGTGIFGSYARVNLDSFVKRP